jgi:hypothetical protein
LGYGHTLLHPAFRPRRQRLVTHLAQCFDHAAFRGIRFFTVARRVLYHR